MLPFTISLRSGEPILDQVVYAVSRAVATGQLQTGDAFPSVRTLSQDLKINPNTAHKIVATLTEQGFLTVRPGIGTTIASPHAGPALRRKALLDTDAERLVVEARHAGVLLNDLMQAIRRHWARMIRRAG